MGEQSQAERREARSRVELGIATALFVAIAGGLTVARGHIVGDLFILLLAPLLAAILTLAARDISGRDVSGKPR